MPRYLPLRPFIPRLYPPLAPSYRSYAIKMSRRPSSPNDGAGPSSRVRTQVRLPDLSDMKTLDKARFEIRVPALGVVVRPQDVKRFKMDPVVRQ